MNHAVCLFLLSSLLTGAQCRPNGAPNTACDSVSPSASRHGADPQTGFFPYMLTGLPANGNYTPGMMYTLRLGNDTITFQGFLVVATDGADQRVGSFAAGGSDSQTTCSDMRGITHTGPNDKSSVSFTWTAPPEGTGVVRVRFSVAMTQMMYWADQDAGTFQEAQPEPSTSPDMPSPSTSPDMPSPSPSSAASPNPTSPPGGGNSVPSNVAGSLATILLAAIAFVMVAAFV